MKISRYSMIAVLSLLVLGIVCSIIIYSNIQSFGKIADEYSASSNLVLNADRDLYQALQAQYMLLDESDANKDLKKIIDIYDENYGQVVDRIGEALGLMKTPTIDSLAKHYEVLLGKWHSSSLKLFELAKDPANQEQANELFETICLKEFKALRGNIDEINEQIDNETDAFVKKSEFYSYLGIGIFVVLLIITIILLNFFAGKIKKPIGELVKVASAMADGDFSNNIQENQKGEVGELANTFITLKSTIQSLNNELQKINRAGEQGQLDVRADSSYFKGVFKDLINGLNLSLDSIIRPLNVAAEYVDRISKGDIPPKIIDGYKGDFNEIKNNLNQCIDAIGGLVGDINMMSSAAVEGKLNTRSDVNKHHGDFKKIMQGMNDTLDAVVSPLNLAAQYIDSVANGDISKSITEEFRGDFNYVKLNVNKLIANLNDFLHEVQKVSNLHQNGEIDVLLNTDRVTGFYREMNMSVNAWAKYHIDSILEMLAVVKSYGDGDLSVKLKRFPGKQAMAHERIDMIQHNLSLVVSELGMVIDATQEGKLNVRGDVSKFTGAYKNIIAGINAALDSVVDPLKLSADYIEKISNGVIPEVITQEVKGEINILKDNLNQLIGNMQGLNDEIGTIINGIGMGRLDVRGKADKFEGVWRELVANLNKIVVQVESPIRELLDILQKISVNDYTVKVTQNYQGIWDELKNATNETMFRLEAVLEVVKDISLGNLDKLSELKSHGKRSANDEMVPSFIKLMEAIELLADDVSTLTEAATNGLLNTRADASKHFGEYSTIVNGFNNTLSALIEPIAEAEIVLGAMSTGDLTARMKGNYKGDHKKLQDNINMLADSLHDLVSKILQGVETTAAASVQISTTADTMATSAQEQSAQTEEVASAIEEMARTVTNNATNAQRTADVARQNREVAKEGGTVVEQTVAKMSDIAAVVKESAENIEKLGESSKQIGEIISVIDDIADQTNLLALNAAIEAARAGEQGRGFAVVADEVRKLAERTTEATKKIAQMIKGIQKDTDNAVKVMHNGNNEVSNGILLADKAGSSLKEIVVSSQHLLDMISQIATASEEQASTGEEITKNVAMISEVTHDSSRRITDIAHSSEGLSKLTEDLRELVLQFKVSGSQVDSEISARPLAGKPQQRYLTE